MVAEPAERPETTPVGLTVAAALLLLLQVPPAKPLEVREVVAPAHKVVVPEIIPALGKALTVTVELAVAEHPLAEML